MGQSMSRELLPGDYYLTRICGWTGVFITLAQWAIGDLSRYAHAGIYLGNGEVAESMPGGLQINPISKYQGKEFVHAELDLTDEQRAGIVELARSMEGTPYSYLGYLYLGLTSFNFCPKWIKRKVSSSKAVICSQFVDLVHCKKDIHLFNDHRLYLDCTPGDLAKIITGDTVYYG